MGAAAEGLVLALRPGMPAVPLPEGCFFLDVSPQSPADIDGAKEGMPAGSHDLDAFGSHTVLSPCFWSAAHHAAPRGRVRAGRCRKSKKKRMQIALTGFRPSTTMPSHPLAFDMDGLLTPHHKRPLRAISELADQHDFATPKPAPNAPSKNIHSAECRRGAMSDQDNKSACESSIRQPDFIEPQWRQESVVEVKEEETVTRIASAEACRPECSGMLVLIVAAAAIVSVSVGLRYQLTPVIVAGSLLCLYSLVSIASLAHSRSRRFARDSFFSPQSAQRDLPRPLSPVCWHAQAQRECHSAATCSACPSTQTSPSPSRGVIAIADADQHAWRQAKRQRRARPACMHMLRVEPSEATAAPFITRAARRAEICPPAEERVKVVSIANAAAACGNVEGLLCRKRLCSTRFDGLPT